MEPGTDNTFTLILPPTNTKAMREFLDRFFETIADCKHMMMLDQAKWHGQRDLEGPAKQITAHPLPELNVVERLWL